MIKKIPMVILVIILILISGFIFIKNRRFSEKQRNNLSRKEEKIEQTLIPTVISLPNKEITPTENNVQISSVGIPHLNEEKIKNDLLEKTIIPEDKLEFQIGERIDRENKILIRGTVKSKDEEHGAGFFAYCDLEKCEVTFVGQEVPKCSDVNPYVIL